MGVKKSAHTFCLVPKRTSPHVYYANRLPHHCMHACRNLFGFSVFKMFYLLNEKSDWRSIFTIKSLATRSSKLDLISIYFDKIFFWLKVAMSIAHELPWYLHWSCHDMFRLFSSIFKSKFWHIIKRGIKKLDLPCVIN